MRPVRKWGRGPYPVAVIHGGPGAPGEVAPVARELSAVHGVLEPFQTETTLDLQVQELRSDLEEHGRVPVVLIGFSYGAFLSWILAARYPALVSRLVLVSSPPFEESYAAMIMETRLERLSQGERSEARELLEQLEEPSFPDKNAVLARLGSLLSRADAFDPAFQEDEAFNCQYEIFRGVWDEVCELRRNRALLGMAGSITCPVVAIHGDRDPHPALGVKAPLARVLPDFRFILLEKCGHRPWIERNASEQFYEVLVKEI